MTDFQSNIRLSEYTDNAERSLRAMDESLTQTSDHIRSLLDGQSKSTLVGSFLWTLVWGVGFVFLAILLREKIHPAILITTLVICLALLLCMVISNVTNGSYYGSVLKYNDELDSLISRVRSCENAVRENEGIYRASADKGWDFPLVAAEAVTEKSEEIVKNTGRLERLQYGILDKGKTYLYYAGAIAFTIAGGTAMLGWGSGMITSITGEMISADTARIMCIVFIILACVGEYFAASLVRDETNQDITNTTIWSFLAGPVIFIAIGLAISLVIVIVVFLFKLALAIAGIALAVAIVAGMSGSY